MTDLVEPNAETKAAIEAARRGELETVGSIDDLFTDLHEEDKQMTDIVERLRELDAIVSRGGWVLLLPEGTIKELPDNLKHLKVSTEDLFVDAADELERLRAVAICKIKPIRTDADYRAALARIDGLMDAKFGSPEGEELDVLTDLVRLYETGHVDSPP